MATDNPMAHLDHEGELLMKATLNEATADVPLPNTVNGEPALTLDADALDWDVSIESPPRRPQGTIHVQLVDEGRSRPAPLADPAAG